MTLDVARIRKDFPILSREVHGRPLVFLDSAASSQKPQVVLDAMRDYYELHHANVHRGIYVLAEEATALYEGARDAVAAFLNAPSRDEVVFTKNSTEALNLVARSLGDAPAGSPLHVGPGTEILVTEMEHHSNLVPWQMLAARTGATLRWLGITDEGRLDLSNLDELLNERTRIVSFVHQSNILGTINPTSQIVRRAREVGALVCVDASQSVPHMAVDVQDLGVDFLACTGHKMLGPTGIGVLWGRLELLTAMPPFLGGGEMIELVRMAGSTYAEPPHKFEAGTPMVAEAVGLTAAVRYLSDLGMDEVRQHEKELTAYALEALETVSSLRILGPRTPVSRGGAISFALGDIHPHDVGQVLDEQGIAVRVGQHCAAPVCHRLGVPATTRASFYVYTTTEEVDALVAGLEHVKRFFRGSESLYQEIILDHYKDPHHKGLREPYDREVHHVNPTCGDEVTLRVKLDGDVVRDVSYDSTGCSISQAATSVMTDLVIGKTVPQAMAVADEFLELMQGKGEVQPDEDVLEDAVAFAGVARYPARVKCALLSWMAWKDATTQTLAAADEGAA